MTELNERRCGFIAVIGAPNAGKSSLINRIVGAKVSIVTHKVQTTRSRVRGIVMDGDTQLVFIDTPGIFSPRRRLDRAMVAAAWEGLDGADAILLIIDAPSYIVGNGNDRADGAARKAAADTDMIIEALKAQKKSVRLVINKIDKLPRTKLLALMQDMNEHGIFDEIYLVSATRGDGVDELKERLAVFMPSGPWMFPEDQLTDISERLMAAEVTREKLFLRLHQELPYESMVETTDWKRTKKGELRVEQTIYVARESQKSIVLGKNGQTLKSVGAAAREELMDMLGETVHLFIFVKVRENWADDPSRYREMGLAIVE